MSQELARLERECRVFTRFIARRTATPYVVSKYVDAHRISPAFAAMDRFDRWLVAFARWSPAVARLADAYGRLFIPGGLLRRKLVLLLAVLESSPPFYRDIDREPSRPLLVALLWLAVSGVGGGLAAVVGTAVFAPLRAVARLGDPRA